MIRRLIVTAAILLLAIGGFSGFADGNPGILNPLGLMFLFVAVLVWRKWAIITGSFSPALLDGQFGGMVGSGGGNEFFRGVDDHYRRDGQHHYREPK